MAYQDDAAILDEDYLLRRVMVDPMHVVFDSNQQRRRPSSAAFEDHPDGSPMSVTIEKDLFELGHDYERMLENQPDHLVFSIAKITAGIARAKGQLVAREEAEGEPAHGIVFGKKSQKTRSAWAKSAEWAIPPSDE